VAKAEAKSGVCALWKLDCLSEDMVESGWDNRSGSSPGLQGSHWHVKVLVAQDTQEEPTAQGCCPWARPTS
jgi:hypothetical protein